MTSRSRFVTFRAKAGGFGKQQSGSEEPHRRRSGRGDPTVADRDAATPPSPIVAQASPWSAFASSDAPT